MATQTRETLEEEVGHMNKIRIDQLDCIYINFGEKYSLQPETRSVENMTHF